MSRDNQHNYYVYIRTNEHHTVFYTGATNSLSRRSAEHRCDIQNSFVNKYNINKLVYYEHTDNIESAITREKALKKLNRRNKVLLINKFNPLWKDLKDDDQ